MLLIVGAFCLSAPAATETAAGPFVLKTTMDRYPAIYKVGETARVTVQIFEAGRPVGGKTAVCSWNYANSNRVEIAKEGTTFDLSLDRPGQVLFRGDLYDGTNRLRGVTAANPDKESTLSVWAGALFEPEKIRMERARPADFDAYWDGEVARLKREAPLSSAKVVVNEVKSGKKGFRVFDVTIPGLPPRPTCGYLVVPEGAAPKSLPALVMFQGAGSSRAEEEYHDGVMFFCINPHGVGNEVPYAEWKAYFAGDGKDYQYSGWEDRGKCFFHGQALRAVRGLEWLKTRPEWNGRDLAVKGVSMGGSQSLQAAALDPDVTLCMPCDPALCDHAGFISSTRNRSGWPWILYSPRDLPALQGAHDAVDPVLLANSDYFDNVFFAQRIKCPTFLATGLGDDVCFAEGVFKMYNALGGPKDVETNPHAIHCGTTNPRADAALRAMAAVPAAGEAMRLNAAGSATPTFRPEDYAEFRRGLRAFYPDECHGKCKDPRQVASVKAIGDELDAFIAANPGYDVLDVRRELYLSMRRHFIPYILPGSPFYFEAGVNGGWCVWRGAESVPGQHARRVCLRFLRDRHLIPQEAWDVQLARGRERFLNVAFGDDTHHIPPFKTIFTKGFCGVRQEVADALAKCPADDPRGRKMLETALVGLDSVHFIQLRFVDEARRQMAAEGLTEEDRRRLQRIADSAMRCPWEPPRTFYEGLNSLWFIREILGYVDGTMNFSLGRPDAWLDGFLKADLAAGRITMSEVRDLVAKFLVTADCHLDDRLEINAYSDQEAEIPLTIGGCDAEGRQVYNDITEMVLDAHLDLGLVFPKLHCRISSKSPQPYLEKIGEMLMRGHAVFALFNDDRHVPNFIALGYPVDRARDYLGCGCWDGNVDSETCVDTANYISVLRMLELTIYRDPETERAARVRVDPIDGARSFEEVRDTLYRNFIRFLRDTLSTYTRYGRAFAEVNAKPVYSACLSGCIESRRDALEGGARFSPRIITLAFLANVVDSLCSIRKICFEDHAATLPEFLAAVRSNWKGPRGEELRLLAMSAPYWGDNSEASNGLMRFWIDSVSRDIEGMTTDKGGPYVLACWIYREFILWGEKTRATPDGRHDGDRLAQGFSPSEFRCKVGATTVFNAIGAIDHSRLYASNANLSFDKLSMTAPVFAAIFRVACRKGMHLLQPNCNSVEDLIDAQKHPERHQDLIVKVCGYSARFISLSKRYQDEVIARHRLK